MNSKRLAQTTLMTALLVAALNTHAAETASGPTAIGWRGDGYSGVMPPDCKPPKDFDGITGKNLRWKAPLPNHGNSSPIVVGNKVFVTCDGGWPEGQDCPQLLCFDANNGKELWRRNLDHFDNLPEAEAKAAKADRAEAWKQHHANCALFWELRHGSPDEARQAAIVESLKKAGIKAREPALKWFRNKMDITQGLLCEPELAKRLKQVGFAVPTWGWRCIGVAMPTPASDGRAVYVATGFRTMSAFDLDGKKLWQHVITENIPTEGTIFTEEFAHSPFLVEGKLLMHWFNHLWCYEPASGKLLWSTKTTPIPAHSMGQPTVLHLDAGGKSVTCIFSTWGQLIRVSDGKLLLEKVGWFGCNAVMSGDGKDVIWGQNGAEWGKPSKRNEERLYYDEKKLPSTFGVRFRLDASGETATSELVEMPFNDREMGLGTYPIHHQGRIFSTSGVIVSWDGKQARLLRPGIRHFSLGSNGAFLADDRLYGQQENNSMKGDQIVRNCFIRWMWVQDGRPVTYFDNPVEFLPAPLDMPPEQQRKIMAQIGSARAGDHKGIYGWHNSYKTPAAAGDRLYVRTFDNLYCFAPEVNGTLKDDPAKVAAIRQETKTEALLPRLASASAQERFEATKRLGALKAALPAPVSEALVKLLLEDPHDEIRLAAMQTLDACDPAGQAGWTALSDKVLTVIYSPDIKAYEQQAKQRQALARMLDGLDQAGVAALLKHWPDADPSQRWFFLEMATTLNWKDAVMLKSLVTAAQEPLPRNADGRIRGAYYALPAYFRTMNAAADPAVAEILLKVYANDESLSMDAAFRSALPQEKYLAWLEGIAIGLKDWNRRRYIQDAWRKVGPAAIPSMQKVAAAMSGADPNLDERGKQMQLEWRKNIEDAIKRME